MDPADTACREACREACRDVVDVTLPAMYIPHEAAMFLFPQSIPIWLWINTY